MNWLFLSLKMRLKRMKNKMPIICKILVVFLKTTVEKTGYDVPNVSDGRTLFRLVWREILLVCLLRDKHCFVLSLYLFI